MKIIKVNPFNTKVSLFTQRERILKKPYVYILITLIIFFTQFLNASPGCMDNSWHMTRPFDAKEYHIVTYQVGKHKTFCQCPCRKLSLNRGECLECGHRHDMQPWIIIRAPKKTKNCSPEA